MIKVIGERNKTAFFALFGFKLFPVIKEEGVKEWSGRESPVQLIEQDDKLLIVDKEFFFETRRLRERYKGKVFPLLFSLEFSPPR